MDPDAVITGNSATPAAGLCGGDPLSQLFCGADFTAMLNGAFQTAIAIGAVLAMLRIAYAGYLYMGSADMWSNKTAAKEVFKDAIIGLLLLLSIWLILYQINPCLLQIDVFSRNKSPSCGGQVSGQTAGRDTVPGSLIGE